MGTSQYFFNCNFFFKKKNRDLFFASKMALRLSLCKLLSKRLLTIHPINLCRPLSVTPNYLGQIVPFHLSDIGEGIKEVTVKEWFVQPGDKVAQFDQICEAQSDKASVTITSRFDGVVKKLHYDIDDIAQTGDPLVDIEVEGENAQVSKESGTQDTTEVQEKDALDVQEEEVGGRRSKKALATPAVRRMASEHGLNVTEIQGTGKDGRVLKEDVINFLSSHQTPAKKGVVLTSEFDQQQSVVKKGSIVEPPVVKRQAILVTSSAQDRDEQVKGITKAMVRSMTESLKIPHFGYKDEIDMSALVQMRAQVKEVASQRGIKLSYMPVILKACSLALSHYPILNAYFDASKETVTYKADHNIGVAMDTPQGLLVPNIKKIQTLSVLEIAEELNRLQELGIKGKLGESDLKSGTFSLSNIGSIGAIGRIQKLPRFDHHDNVVAAHIMNVSWSADHRIIDGATMARFSNQMKTYVENPTSMILDLR